MIARLTIRARLILLSAALLVVLIGTNAYLNRKLAEDSAGMAKAVELLGVIREASNAQLAFGEMRYWLTDLAVSVLPDAEREAAEARKRLERHLDRLAVQRPKAVAAVRDELSQYEDFAGRAVEEYTAGHREAGNALLTEASRHSVTADRRLGAVAAELTRRSIAARETLIAEAARATRLSRIVVSGAVLIGALLTILVLRSIAVPLRRLVVAMDRLNAGDLEVEIPPAGPDEIGAMARTLAAFRDTLEELRRTLAQFEALRGVGRAVGSTLDQEAVLGLVVARAVEFSQAGAGLIYEYEEEAREFRFRMSHGADPALIAELEAEPIRLGEGAIGRAAATGAPVQVADLLAPSDFAAPRFWEILGRAGYRSLLAAPLRHEDRILGGLTVVRREIGLYPEEVVRLVEAFATQSALAIRNARLFDEQRRRERELRAAHEQLKTAQASLIQAEKMASLGQLTAGIAHEIKNPLNFVNNFAELSRELLDEIRETIGTNAESPDDAHRSELDELVATLSSNLEKIAMHGRRADGIVKSMLSHSRGGSGERRPADLNALAEEALGLAYHGARAQDSTFNITIERDFDQAMKPIEIVPQDITRVFLNLFGNGFYAATKRRREGGDPAFEPILKVTTREMGDAIEVRVRDNGIGISPGVREKLFTPFFTTKPTGEGTGLGLSISYDIIVQEHGGTITVDSAEGEFTEFTLRLPRRNGVGAEPIAAARAAV